MKQFDLDAALKGEPVMLRNGQKAWVVADLSRLGCKGKKHGLIVVNIYGGVYDDYESNGRLGSYDRRVLDIIGMWEQPPEMIKIGNFEFPKGETEPLEVGEKYYVPTMLSTELVEDYIWEGDTTDMQFLESGLTHRTEEAAEQHARVLLAISQGNIS